MNIYKYELYLKNTPNIYYLPYSYYSALPSTVLFLISTCISKVNIFIELLLPISLKCIQVNLFRQYKKFNSIHCQLFTLSDKLSTQLISTKFDIHLSH